MELQGKTARAVLVGAALALVAGLGVLSDGFTADIDGASTAMTEQRTAGVSGAKAASGAGADGMHETDREILRAKLAFAEAEDLDAAGIGAIVAAIGRTFVGTPYVPHVLDVPGPERLIINLRELDCVTFVESTLAISRLVAAGFDPGDSAFAAFKDELRGIRYRGGVIDGYASRLHYFSEWISDNERKGIVRDITREIGGVPLPGRIHFMSEHRDAYPQLAEEANLREIRRIERRLSGLERYYIPEDRIADVAQRIRSGDIIAATSTVDGLDIAHTGIALWVDGELHLLHAPLVGESVQISKRTLAERVKEIDGQDGIMVARPVAR